MILIFKNWNKFNPPSSNTNSWFRLNSNIISRPIWDELNGDCFKVYIYMLCQANENEIRGQFHFSAVSASRRVSVSEKTINRTIEILKAFQIIELRAPSGHFVNSALTLPTNETNDTKRTNELIHGRLANFVFYFDALYQEYPRKEKKKQGIKICLKEIKTKEDFLLLEQAIRNYRLKKQGTEPKYLMQFSTFMGEWREWTDPQTGTAESLKEKSGLEKFMEKEALKKQQENGDLPL